MAETFTAINASGATAQLSGATSAALDAIVTGVSVSGTIAPDQLATSIDGVWIAKDLPSVALKRRTFRILLDNLSSDLDLSTFAKREQFRLRRSQEDAEFISDIIGADS